MVILLILTIILLFFIEGLPIIKKKSRKEFTTFSVLLGICLLLVIGYGLKLPTPFELADSLLRPIGEAIYK